jgi:hypothetical protein
MLDPTRTKKLKWCPNCRLEAVTSELVCPCGHNLLTVVFSPLDGRRITDGPPETIEIATK